MSTIPDEVIEAMARASCRAAPDGATCVTDEEIAGGTHSRCDAENCGPYRSLVAALAAAGAKGFTLMGWQPIETAPRDETLVLLWSRQRSPRFPLSVGYWRDDCRGRGWYGPKVKFAGDLAFTHWMPLPAAPSVKP